jgi:UDP-N-acetylglucosamine--N-acetylmuramyl-(pentapeptide) pyrophosphoryl-undecaprenol N-acetylglucosamine transferase
MILAGGSGGHLFPAFAAAEAMRGAGWRIAWLGVGGALEERVCASLGCVHRAVAFSPPRKNYALFIPRLLRAMWKALGVLRTERPSLLLGFGGFASVPGALAGVLIKRLPLVIHESNAVAGRANRLLARFAARRVLSAHPGAFGDERKVEIVGTPARAAFYQIPPPQARYRERGSSPLSILVLGGSGGARVLNEIAPAAFAKLAAPPTVLHQCGRGKLQECEAAYARAGIQARIAEFVDAPASAMANADLVICRAGASTLAEIAAVGVAAFLIPYPFASDNHQAANAAAFAANGAAEWADEKDLSAAKLSSFIAALERGALCEMAQKARAQATPQAAAAIAAACAAVCEAEEKEGKSDAGD